MPLPLLLAALLVTQSPTKPLKPVRGCGEMTILPREGAPIPMPLERTRVEASVAGMGSRVTVRQTFANPSKVPIEAVYRFPLPDGAAVDRMRIAIGARVIEGEIRRREEARKIYEDAKQAGKTAALLDQETGNVFTQSVANIAPGAKVEVEISYVGLLAFKEGEFEFVFPMVVAPRYLGAGTPEPGKMATPTLPAGVRSGQTIELAVTIHGGAPIRSFASPLHEIESQRTDAETVRVRLKKRDEIPNRDFVLRYRTAQGEVQESLLTTFDAKRGGAFALVLAPPPRPEPSQRGPKEVVFVVDQSGSQGGFAIEKSKELALKMLDTMGPKDGFNVLGFSNEVNPLWPAPRLNTPENLEAARRFVRGLQANGGTQMEKAVIAALSPEVARGKVRVVLFNTDGLAGQEGVILRNVRRYRGSSRLFTFGIGSSVNRSLIDAMSLEGRGESEVVTLAEEADAAATRFAERLETPLLTNVEARFEGDGVTDLTPEALPDVFAAKPVVLYGRYARPGRSRLVLTGLSGGKPWRRVVQMDLPSGEGDGSSVASLWARSQIAALKSRSYADAATEAPVEGKDPLREAVARIALEYGILSEETSFVAVDRSVSNPGGKSVTVGVPLEMPDGMTMGTSVVARRIQLRSADPNFIGLLNSGAAAARPSSGGGGYGGGAGGFAGGAVPSGSPGAVPGGIDFISFDPTDNSLLTDAERKATGRRTVEIAKGLLEAKAPVALRISVKEASEANLAALKKAGFTELSHDGAGLVFGSADGATIRRVAKLVFVLRISPLRE